VIDAALLLKDLQGELGRLSADLLTHVQQNPEVRGRLEGEWRKAFDAQRTGRTFEDWLDDRLTQVAVAWLLAFVFVRFCEDNGLVDEARIAGVGVRGGEARDRQQRYFAQHPHASDRDYLHEVLRSAAQLPGLDGVVGEGESPLWLVDPPADAITRVLALFRSTDESGGLVHEFTDPELSTRFLGDLYQDLSDHAKATYALLQTPEFVEEFILDRTLDPAIETFGLANTTMIDPTCGSGHFLLGGFGRIFEAWRVAEPGVSPREHAERALKAVTGVDLNPFAAAIARFRLLVAALFASGERRLADAPRLEPDVAVGDSLLWGAMYAQIPGLVAASARADRQFLYQTEHGDRLRAVFGSQYAAVVGNPPYIVARDRALNAQYRERYPDACRGKYSLAAPFMQCFFELAVADDGYGHPAGFVGMITANSFMKREFGKNLVERLIPSWDLTHVVDASGVDIPGHGTPTVLLFGRYRAPFSDSVRTVMGVKGQQTGPAESGLGIAWRSIVDNVDDPGFENAYVSVLDVDRSRFCVHPWSIGGGGASELKERLEAGRSRVSSVASSAGFFGVSGADDLFSAERPTDFLRFGIEAELVCSSVSGEDVRDWEILEDRSAVIFPYKGDLVDLPDYPGASRHLWPCRSVLGARATFDGNTYLEAGRSWWEWHQVSRARASSGALLAFAEIATHNHFAWTVGRKVLKQTAPVLDVREDADGIAKQSVLGALNSSCAAFWLHQCCQPKDRADQEWAVRYVYNGAKVLELPVPDTGSALRLAQLAESMQKLSSDIGKSRPSASAATGGSLKVDVDGRLQQLLGAVIAVQEELDWECLHLYGVTEASLTAPDGLEVPPLNLGERAFEVVMARRMAAGELETAWFERHGSTPVTELPSHWPDWYKDLVNERIRLIETDRDVGLIERPEHKRRWAREPWEKQQERALREWLQDRLEARDLWFEGTGAEERAVCRSVAQLADRVMATDPEFLDVARLWKGQVEIDSVQVVAELVAEEHVPAQSGARYKGKGFDKRRQWERTWELQKMEDDGLPLPGGLERIPVPPKYKSGDFEGNAWRLRRSFDIPKERFTSIWGAESAADGSMVLAWAGFDHVQLTQAIGSLLVDRQATDGWDADRSWPLVVAMAEQLFWLDLWHHEHDPRWGDSPANLFRSMVTEQAHRGGRTLVDVADWRAPAATRGRKKKDGA
jgi:hypothetical protein